MENNTNAQLKTTDYSDSQVYDRRKAKITALLKWLECEFFGLFIFMSLMAVTLLMKNAGSFIFGTFGLICYICVMADFGMKEGAKARIKNTVRGDCVRRSYGFVLGLFSALPAFLSYIWLLVGYFTQADLPTVLVFKLMNLGIFGYIDLFVPDMQISSVSAVLLVIYPIITLLYPVTAWITFKIGYDNEDLQSKIVYKKQ